MTTDLRRRSVASHAGLVTTAVVSLAAAATIGWAAATPIGTQPAAAPADPSNGTAAIRTARDVQGAQQNLQQVRRDLARLLAKEDDLPRARLANLRALTAQVPSVQVPQAAAPAPVTQVAPAPATHTTSGASGAG